MLAVTGRASHIQDPHAETDLTHPGQIITDLANAQYRYCFAKQLDRCSRRALSHVLYPPVFFLILD
jgi:hypothetical protein